MIWAITIAILAALVCFILCTPFILTVDTHNSRYSLSWWGIASARFIPDPEELILVRLKFLFLTWRLLPLKQIAKKTPEHVAAHTKGRRRRKSRLHGMPGRMWRVLRSFNVRRCDLDLDTGDAALNATLYPIMWWLSSRKRDLRINYQERFYANVLVRNSLIKMLYAFIRSPKNILL